MNVYVRWYGKVVEGELLDGEHLGMKLVRIPLDGHHPVAMFTPQHVYRTEAEASAQSLVQAKPKNPEPKPQKDAIEDIMPDYDRLGIEAFKEAYWDHERNHLRIDKLDEFYFLWRMAMTPFGFIEVKDQKELKTNRLCAKCGHWEFTHTLGSPDKPVWHCRHGFTPSGDCQAMAAYNEECMRNDPKQLPSGYTYVDKPGPKTRCRKCIHLDYDHLSDRKEQVAPDEHFCGLHGRTRVDPDGQQPDLNHKGGCGFVQKPQPRKPTKKELRSSGEIEFTDSTQLSLFD